MRILLTAALGLLLAGTAIGHEFKAGAMTIEHPWARPAASGNIAAYFVIENGGDADRLIGIGTAVAKAADLHSTTIDAQGVGRMTPVQAVDIPAGATATFAPGGLHVMLMGLTRPLEAGQEFPLTLMFEKAGAVTVEVLVEKTASQGASEGMQHKHGSTSP
jgi:periplasmic copper chaperone A